eukprot:11199470-Lingulodinium_polyedra.AAC.1
MCCGGVQDTAPAWLPGHRGRDGHHQGVAQRQGPGGRGEQRPSDWQEELDERKAHSGKKYK